MTYELWKLVHLAGVLALVASLGGSVALAQAGRAAEGKAYRILHGIALAIVFLAGFGTLAKLGLHGPSSWGAWVWIKLAVWLLLGASVALIRRAERRAGALLWAILALAILAAWAALTQPGA